MTLPVVFTDLDGTLLDQATYSHEPALPALRRLRQKQIPLLLCSSKTRPEIEYYRRLLDNHDPYVSENGGGIFIPEGYFDASMLPPSLDVIRQSGALIIRLGTPYERLRQVLVELRAEGFAVTGFGDMTAVEVAELTGLTREQAVLAKAREFDEPFVFNGNPGEDRALMLKIRERGLHLTKGEFFHLLGDNDKGRAVAILAALFRQKLGEIFTVALGDSLNDLPMLQRVDYPVAVRKPDGSYDRSLTLEKLARTGASGPAGWNEAILALFGGPVGCGGQK